MKRLMILAGVICLVTMLLPACAPAPEPEPEAAPEPVVDLQAEEVAIRKVMEQQGAALNEHDAKTLAALRVETFENWEGDRKGRAAFEQWISEVFEYMKDLQFKQLDEIGLIFVTSDVAIYKWREEITGWLDPDRNSLPPMKRIRAAVCVKKNGEWLQAARFSRPIQE